MTTKGKSERLSILSDLEEFAFYGFPDFTDEQRATYFSFEEQEWDLIATCPSLRTRVYCALQIGYFKSKKLFFPLHKIPQEDIHFILSRYFQGQTLPTTSPISKHEYYLQRKAICHLFGYKLWSHEFSQELLQRAELSIRRDVSPNFIAQELLDYLQNKKIVRPGYTTLQSLVSTALGEERRRLKLCLQRHLTEEYRQTLDQLLKNENTLSALAALKQDAKNFKFSIMKIERQKHAILEPLYDIAQVILPLLSISQQNITHYASLINYYTIYDLERFDAETTYLYLLCYVFKRFQQINDNLVEAFTFQVKILEKEVKDTSTLDDTQAHIEQQIGRLILLYVDDFLSDLLTLADMRKKAFEILPKEVIRSLGEQMVKKPRRKQNALWQERDKAAKRYKSNLRPLFMKIHFASQNPDNPLLEAIHWLQHIFSKHHLLSQQSLQNFPCAFISKRLSPYLFILSEKGEKVARVNRYEIAVYLQIAKQMETGSIYITNSVRYRPFSHDLVSLEEKETILKALDIPWLRAPRKEQLDSLFKELDALWRDFDRKIKQGTLKYLKYNSDKKELIGVKPKILKEEDPQKQTFYSKLPLSHISDVLRFFNEKCGFLSAFTPLQPRYSKQKLDDDHLIAVLISQGMNIGHYKMAQTSDIPYHVLESTYQQYCRLKNLRKAHDIIANAIMSLSIFPHYTFDRDLLYGALDGQKYEMITPTAKARHSRKYYKKGRGVVAYTLLSNHVPVQTDVIGPHEHESYFVFDIWYKNTSLIQPTVLTGDMHCVNKANFAILHWFGAELRPRFTNLKKEISTISSPKDPSHYQKFLIQPTGQINQEIILDENDRIDRVIATLALKEASQSTLIKKLCSLSPHHNTRKAIFEFDKLCRSIYTLKCALDSTILSNVHRSQNRIESYHTLRAAIAKAGGRKALLGRTDLEVEISNQCGCLIAISIIYYNASIHSRLLEKNPTKKQLKALKKSSPAAWRHLHFTGNFTFYTNKKDIDIDKIIENIEF